MFELFCLHKTVQYMVMVQVVLELGTCIIVVTTWLLLLELFTFHILLAEHHGFSQNTITLTNVF